MSMHKIPCTTLEEKGLVGHHLPVGKPSQLSDAFRYGMLWAQNNMNLTWISSKTPPVNEDGKWSETVIALADNYQVFSLACMDGHWQRTSAFIDSGATKVIGWIPMFKEIKDE